MALLAARAAGLRPSRERVAKSDAYALFLRGRRCRKSRANLRGIFFFFSPCLPVPCSVEFLSGAAFPSSPVLPCACRAACRAVLPFPRGAALLLRPRARGRRARSPCRAPAVAPCRSSGGPARGSPSARCVPRAAGFVGSACRPRPGWVCPVPVPVFGCPRCRRGSSGGSPLPVARPVRAGIVPAAFRRILRREAILSRECIHHA